MRGKIIFVNVNNAREIQDGTSWKKAFSSLQSALDKAQVEGGAKIWIASGTYIPSKIYAPNGVPGGAYGISTLNLMTFDLPNNVALYGGFKGTERKLSQCDVEKNKTILSGVGNSWHVVIAGNDIAQTGVKVLLDGLTITRGNAQGPIGVDTLVSPFTYSHSYGAGIYAIFGSNLKVKNVTFQGNTASGSGGEGGGFFSINCDVLICKCHFSNNTASEEGGGIEILNTFETQPHHSLIEECIFDQNFAIDFGGAITAEGTLQNPKSSAEIKGCRFQKNSAQVGGAIAVDSLRAIVKECVFTENFGAVAGGALSTANIVNTIATASHPPALFVPFPTTISRCIFRNNVTEGNVTLHDILLGGLSAGVDFPLGGGAIVCYLNGILKISRSEFRDNEAINSNGGAILNGRSSAVNPLGVLVSAFKVHTQVRKCLFLNNRALNANGGAIASLPSTAFPSLPITVADTLLDVTHSQFKCNEATLKGGGLYLNTTTAHLSHNCFKHNRGKDIYAIDSIINGTPI